MEGFKVWMNEENNVTRWRALRVFMIGMFAGACLMFVFALGGVI